MCSTEETKTPLNVLHVVAGGLSGGAARGAFWLHQGLREIGVDSNLLISGRNTLGADGVVSYSQGNLGKLARIVTAKLDALPNLFFKNKNIFSSGLIGFDFTKTKEYKRADVVNLHWINGGFVDIKLLKKIDKPIVWTMRDMWPMTGGCHYSLDCVNYQTGCGHCPQLDRRGKYDLSRYVLQRKKRYIPDDITLVGISTWLSDCAGKSELFENRKILTISNNINTDEFFPLDKGMARNILGIETHKKIVLVGSTSLKDFYKGFSKFLDATTSLDTSDFLLCFFGNVDADIVEKLGFEYKIFGRLGDEISMRLVYSCADVFVAPSIQEAFGKTIAESMACGTPVVCFDATGPQDIVDHKVNGYMATPFDPKDLANGIRWVVYDSDYSELANSAVNKANSAFNASTIAKQYLELYMDLTKLIFNKSADGT